MECCYDIAMKQGFPLLKGLSLSSRLKRAREREAERRRTESAEKREKRLRESREKAAFRRRQETSEERERRLETSRIRAAQRR